MVLNLVLLLIIIILLIFLSMIWPPDSPWAPWWRTSDNTIRIALKLANVKKGDIVYDLGSGDGKSVIISAKEFGAKGVGVEIDPLRFYISKLLAKIFGVSKNVKFIKKNFYNVNISDADVIFTYLVPKTLAKLKHKFLKELKKGTKVIAVNYEIDLPKIKSIKVDNRIVYLYRIP